MEEYTYEKHGILYIVYHTDDDYFCPATTEDARFDSEEKAKEHCRILNERAKIRAEIKAKPILAPEDMVKSQEKSTRKLIAEI